MNPLDERRVEFKRRLRNNELEAILRKMKHLGITIEELQDFKSVSKEEKLRERREVQSNRAKAAASLVRAREAKQQKLLAKKGET